MKKEEVSEEKGGWGGYEQAERRKNLVAEVEAVVEVVEVEVVFEKEVEQRRNTGLGKRSLCPLEEVKWRQGHSIYNPYLTEPLLFHSHQTPSS